MPGTALGILDTDFPGKHMEEGRFLGKKKGTGNYQKPRYMVTDQIFFEMLVCFRHDAGYWVQIGKNSRLLSTFAKTAI